MKKIVGLNETKFWLLKVNIYGIGNLGLKVCLSLIVEGGFGVNLDGVKMHDICSRVVDSINHLHDKCIILHSHLRKKVGYGLPTKF